MDPNQNDQTQNPSTANQEVSAQPPPEPTPPPPPSPHKELDTHTLIAILLLVLIYPIGLIFMWFMTKWPKWLKILLTLPVILAIAGVAMALFLATADPFHKIEDSRSRIAKTPTPTPVDNTANWKTYVATQSGFSFKYPSTLKLKEYANQGENSLLIHLYEDIEGMPIFDLSISISSVLCVLYKMRL